MNTLAALAIAISFYVVLGLVLSLAAYGGVWLFWRSCGRLGPEQRADLCVAAILGPPVAAVLLAIAAFGRPDGPHDWCRHIQHFCFDQAEQGGFCLLILGLPILLAVTAVAVAARRAVITLAATVRLNRQLSRQLEPPSAKLQRAVRDAIGTARCPIPLGETEGAQPLSLVFGVRHPRCLFTHPLVEAATEEELAGVMAHELAHVQRRDNFQKLVLRLAATLQWMFPWVARLLRQWQIEVELACDDCAVRTTGRPRTLAAVLLKVAQPRPAPAVVSRFCEAGQDGVRVRVERLMAGAAMTSGSRSRRSWAQPVLLTGLGSAALLAGAVAAHRLLAPSIACLADNLLRHGH
jgi:beta-lactamase regulating signal transducer with metallopeptidase domain